jgi:hypothetical protein
MEESDIDKYRGKIGIKTEVDLTKVDPDKIENYIPKNQEKRHHH